ncbi:hypothetical protein RCH14_000963 [Massilia sp. MP_M2]|uniref:hypothetical protein n=1 Tax=Massilia sp. MP_M2 TaxID=3071713 RepID=UPI00319E80F6
MRIFSSTVALLISIVLANDAWPGAPQEDAGGAHLAVSLKQDVELQVAKAFALYARERAEPKAALKADLRRQRAEAFALAALWQHRDISESFDSDQRLSNLYALELFKYALYLEYAADVWKARAYFSHTREILIENVKSTDAVPPKYNGVSILRLCDRELQRLRLQGHALGPRPTRVSILQSFDELGPAEFLHSIDRAGVQQLVEARDIEAYYAYLQALDIATDKGARPRRKDIGLDVIGALARRRSLRVTQADAGGPLVIGIGASPELVYFMAAQVRAYLGLIARWYGRSQVQRGLPILVLRDGGTPADWAFLTAALNEGAAVPGQRPFAAKEIGVYLAPERSETADGGLALVDSYIVFTSSFAVPDDGPEWLNWTFMANDGEGAYALRRLRRLLAAGRQGWSSLPSVPLYPMPRELSAARVYLLQAGAFLRFLNGLPAPGKPARSVLAALMQGRQSLSGGDLEQNWQALEAASGLQRPELQAAFDSFIVRLEHAGPADGQGSVEIDAAVAAAFRKAYAN